MTPRLTERHAHLIEMVMFDSANVAGYRLSAANSLDAAFAGATAMFVVPHNGTFRSPSVVARRLGTTQYDNRGLTRVFYDPEDYWAPATTLPHDVDGSYVRLEEQKPDGSFRPPGPILVVPPPSFFTNTRPNLIVAGTAPNVAASATLVPPPGAMHFVLPRFCDSVTVINTGGHDLYIGFNPGMPEFAVPSGTKSGQLLPDAAVSDVFVRGSGGTTTFSIFFALVNAEMA